MRFQWYLVDTTEQTVQGCNDVEQLNAFLDNPEFVVLSAQHGIFFNGSRDQNEVYELDSEDMDDPDESEDDEDASEEEDEYEEDDEVEEVDLTVPFPKRIGDDEVEGDMKADAESESEEADDSDW